MANGLKGVFSATEAPFLLAPLLGVILGVIAWGVTHIVDRSLDSPILEISEVSSANTTAQLLDCANGSVKRMKVPYLVNYTLRNISRTRLFKELSFLVRLPEESDAKIIGIRLLAVAPAFPGEYAETCGADHGSFERLDFHPGWQLMLSIGINKQAIPKVHLSKSTEAVFLKKQDLETRLIRHEAKLIVLLVIMMILVAAGYLIFLYRQQRKREPCSTAVSQDPTEET